jgi:hypothetical protein
MKRFEQIVAGILLASVLLQPLGLVSAVRAETVGMEYPAPTDPDPKPIHAPRVVNGVDYQYDANGNLVSDGERVIEWNQDNLPIKITNTRGNAEVNLYYDASGTRVAKEVKDAAGNLVSKTTYVNQYYQQSAINNRLPSITLPMAEELPPVTSNQLPAPR